MKVLLSITSKYFHRQKMLTAVISFLCPGLEYDRSPCGTGTSAKLACLYEDGKLKEGEIWRQESIVGSVFEGWVNVENGSDRP